MQLCELRQSKKTRHIVWSCCCDTFEEHEYSGTNEGGDECDDVGDEVDDDDDDELLDELDDLSEEEVLRVKESVKPIRLVLTKVSQFNKHKHHSTNQQWFYSFKVYPMLSRIIHHCPA